MSYSNSATEVEKFVSSKNVSLDQALALANRVGCFATLDSIKAQIVSRSDCPLERAMELAIKERSSSEVGADESYKAMLKAILKREDWRSLAIEEAVKFAEDTYDNKNVPLSIIYRADCPLEIAAELVKSCSENRSEVIELFMARDDWKKLPISDAMNIARKTYQHELSWNICERNEWKQLPIEEAISFAEKSDGKRVVVESILSRTEIFTLSASRLLKFAHSLCGSHDCERDQILELLFHDKYNTPSVEELIELVGKYCNYCYYTERLVMSHDGWESVSLVAAIKFASNYEYHTAMATIVSRDDWKKLPIKKALELLKIAEYDDVLAEDVVSRTDCSFKKAIWIAGKTSFHWRIVNHLVSHENWLKTPIEYLVKRVKGDCVYFIKAIISREDCSVEQALELTDMANYHFTIVPSIVCREDCSIKQALKLLKKTDYNDKVLRTIVSRKDW